MSAPLLYCGTRPADAHDLRALVDLNYGHFTSMRVRAGAVQGLELHLARLREGHATLFDAEVDEAQLRHDLRMVLAGQGEASVRITGFARDFDFRDPLRTVQPEWLISVGRAAPAARVAPVMLQSFVFVRPLPQIKHVAMLPLFHYRRLARKSGCDDALFVEGTHADARVVEGSVWNIGFWDGDQIVWPQGPALRGTAEQLLQAGLEAAGWRQRSAQVPLSDVGNFRAAFTANARGLQAVAGIDAVRYEDSHVLLERLAQILESRPWQAF